jgi:hypothetical protein
MATPKRGTVVDMATLKALNKANGYHFFDTSTLRFFDSKILPTVYTAPDGWYFVTSEQFHGSAWPTPVLEDGARKYTVRRMNDDGSIDTIGEFNSYTTREAAKTAAQEAAARVYLA